MIGITVTDNEFMDNAEAPSSQRRGPLAITLTDKSLGNAEAPLPSQKRKLLATTLADRDWSLDNAEAPPPSQKRPWARTIVIMDDESLDSFEAPPSQKRKALELDAGPSQDRLIEDEHKDTMNNVNHDGSIAVSARTMTQVSIQILIHTFSTPPSMITLFTDNCHKGGTCC